MFSCIVSFLYRLTKTMLILNWTKLVQFDWETRARGCVCVCGLHKIRWDQGPGDSEFGYYCCERGLVIAYWLKLSLLGSFLSLRIPLNRWWLYFYFFYFCRSRNGIEQLWMGSLLFLTVDYFPLTHSPLCVKSYVILSALFLQIMKDRIREFLKHN